MLRVELLGGFRVEREGVAVSAFHSQKAQSLLAYLMIYRDQAHPRSVLADLFWGESDEVRAQANLRNALYSLRHVLEGPQRNLGEFILTEGSAVRFKSNQPYSLDVEEFETLLAKAAQATGWERAHLLDRAAALYTGDLLPGFYDDWVLIEQEHLKELYLHALKELAVHYTEHKDYGHAIACARRAHAANPLQEDFHRMLMQLRALTGDRTTALRQYRECEALLQRELNAVPLPETHALYERILRNQPLDSGGRAALPPALAPFVGRERELQELAQLWHRVQSDQGQAVFIGGEIGVGKTTLVQRFLEQIQQPLLHGAAYASGGSLPYQPLLQAVRAGLKTLSTPALAQLPVPARSELAQFIPELQQKFPDLQPNPQLSPAQAKIRWFAALTSFFELLACERPTVLFLDDLHWADEATLEYLGHLVGAKDALPLLVIGTYRAEEAGAGSRLRTWLDQLGPGRSYHSLILPRLSQEETHWLVEQLVSGAVRELPRRLYEETEGNPLFLTELVRSLVQSGLLHQDQEGRWKLTTEEISAAHWPENLRELIGASLRRAPTRAQSLLGLAAVMGRAFELSVLREVLHKPEEQLLDRLDELCKAGLLVEREGRYQFYHELVRQVLYESLNTDRKRLWHSKVAQALERLYPTYPEELSGDLARHFEQAHLWKKALGYAERAGAHAQNVYAHTEAIKFFAKAAELSQKMKNYPSQAQNLNNVGKVHVGVGEYTEALLCYDQALKICQQNGDREGEGRSFNNIGVVHQEQGQYEDALRCYQQTLAICRELGLRRGEGISLNNIGNIYQYLGQYEDALSYYQQSLEIRRALGDRRGEGISLDNIGGLYQNLGRYDEALSLHRQALKLRQELGDRTGEGDTLENLGMLLVSTGRTQEAVASLEQALAIRRQIAERRGQGYCFYILGHCARDQRQLREALEHYKRARLLFAELETKAEFLLALSAEGAAHLQLQELQEALARSSEAVRLQESGQRCATPQEIYFNHSHVLTAHNQKTNARTYLQRAYQEVMQRANKIRDPKLRESFLKNVPINRQILQAWEAAQRESKPADKKQ